MASQIVLSSPSIPLGSPSVSEARIRMTEGLHDLVTVSVDSRSLSASSPFVTGLPIALAWGAGKDLPIFGKFQGYIDGISTPYTVVGAKRESNSILLRCVGTTYFMKSSDYAVFSNSTVDNVARRIADQFRLSCIADPHPFVWDNLSQAGDSWWEFLAKLAKKVGYSLYVLGSTLYFVDRRNAGSRISTPERYRVVDAPRDFYDVMLFSPSASSGDGPAGVSPGTHVVRGVSTPTGNPFTLSSDAAQTFYGGAQLYPPQFQRVVADTANSIGEGKALLDAAVANNLFTMFAEVQVMGNPRLHPGSLITLDMADGNTAYSGTWYVLDVTHTVNTLDSVTYMKIGTDAAGFAIPQPQRVLNNAVQSRSLPPTVFRSGKWAAQWSTVAA